MRYLILVGFCFIAGMSYLSQTGYFGDSQIQDITNIAWSIATPAWRTFSIRGLIYVWLIIGIFYQLSSHQEHIRKIRPYLFVNFICHGLWYAFSTIDGYIWVSAILIILMWLSLLPIHTLLSQRKNEKRENICLAIPISIYTSWLTIAAPLNIAWAISDLWGTWAVTSIWWVLLWISISYGATIWITKNSKRISFLAVTIWALAGVMVAREFDAPIIFWTAGGLMLLTLIIIAYNRKSLRW